jgi:hypothetical protein
MNKVVRLHQPQPEIVPHARVCAPRRRWRLRWFGIGLGVVLAVWAGYDKVQWWIENGWTTVHKVYEYHRDREAAEKDAKTRLVAIQNGVSECVDKVLKERSIRKREAQREPQRTPPVRFWPWNNNMF